MYLTREEEAVLAGERGPTLRTAMEILTALGDIYDADSLVPIKSAQIAGVSYKTIGDAGLEWISDLEGQVVVPSILNPAGMDLSNWQEMGVDEGFAAKQIQIIEAYRKLGVRCECTCTPYHIDDSLAAFGDHLAWSESSAVSYANSVIGARTNREGGPSALAAALVGKTPNYGYHLDENRVPTIGIKVEGQLKGADYGALGYLVGDMVGSDVPMFLLGSTPTNIELKALGAAMAASGAVALYHVQGVTPEVHEVPGEILTIERGQIDEVFQAGCPGEPDLVALGCPHYSADELSAAAEFLEKRPADIRSLDKEPADKEPVDKEPADKEPVDKEPVDKEPADKEPADKEPVDKEIWIFTSRQIRDQNPGLVQRIEAAGAKVFVDTCMVVSPATDRFSCAHTDSGKALKYIPNLCGVGSKLINIRD